MRVRKNRTASKRSSRKAERRREPLCTDRQLAIWRWAGHVSRRNLIRYWLPRADEGHAINAICEYALWLEELRAEVLVIGGRA